MMKSRTVIPEGYRSILNLYETQDAIGMIKHIFSDELSDALNLKRVSAPLFVDPYEGINDNLSGVERPVRFQLSDTRIEGEIVQSLAKWKRYALYRYNFFPGKGIWTDMNAIRRDEVLDNLHSIYVDQWDWEKVILHEERSLATLKLAVRGIVESIRVTSRRLRRKYPELPKLSADPVAFIDSEQLEELFPDLTPSEREEAFVKDHPITFIMRIGYPLKNGKPHSGRAPDYDDWNLNGDLLYYHETLQCAMELSSMGVRVSPETLRIQLDAAGCEARRELPFHQLLLAGKLPQTMGGGIGQSRLSMLLLGKAHIGEVQSSVWDPQTMAVCEDAGVILL